MDKLISGTASYIAAIPDVAAMLENGYPDSTVTRDLDSSFFEYTRYQCHPHQ